MYITRPSLSVTWSFMLSMMSLYIVPKASSIIDSKVALTFHLFMISYKIHCGREIFSLITDNKLLGLGL